MKKTTFLVWLFMLYLSGYSQIIDQTSFENYSDEHQYVQQNWVNDGFDPKWVNGFNQSRVYVDNQFANSGNKSIRIKYPAGNYGPGNTGAQAPLRIPPANEYYVSYSVRFSDNFDWGGSNEGGKLPGLAGGNNCSGCSSCSGTNGFTARLMWRQGGRAVLYLYHMDKSGSCGDDLNLKTAKGNNFHFQKGQWYTITQRVKVNTPGLKNGEVELWIDGVPALLVQNIRFVTNGDQVDNFYFSTFHGGGDGSWAPGNDCYTWFDDVKIGKSFSDVYGGSNPPPPQGNGGLPVVNFTASTHDGNIPENTYDDNLNTRWSAEGDGEWMTHELDDTYLVESVDMAFFRGDERSTSFDVQLSENGSGWTTVFSWSSSGNSLNFENFDFPDQNARFVRIVGHGNSVNDWNSITELRINGSGAQQNIPVTGISVAPTTVSVDEGQSSQLSVNISPANATNQSVSWSSSNPAVATVNSSGMVSGLSAGSATITVTTADGGFTATSNITVNCASGCNATTTTLNPTADAYVRTGTFSGNNYGSDNNLVVKNSPSDDYYREAYLKFNLSGISNITSATLRLNGNANLTVVAYGVDNDSWTEGGINANNVPSAGSQLASANVNGWGEFDVTTFVAAQSDGQVSFMIKDPNTSDVMVNISSKEGSNPPELIVTYGTSNIPVTGLAVSPTSINLEEGQTSQLVATVNPSDATDSSVSWSSSNASVATVSASGLVIAVADGTANITVTTNDGGFTATSTITVSTPTQGGNLPIIDATASTNDGNGPDNVYDDDLGTRWSADGNGQWLIVELDNTYWVESVDIAFYNGNQRSSTFDLALSTDGSNWTTVFSASSSGNTLNLESFDFADQNARYVRYTGFGNSVNSWNSITEFEVYGSAAQNVAVSGLSVSPTSLSLEEGETGQLSATVSPANATNSSVSWSSSNNSVATVNSSGLVTAISAGSATITATTVDGGFMANSAITVTVPTTPTGYRYLRYTSVNVNNFKLLEIDWKAGGTSVPSGNLSSNNSGGVAVSGSAGSSSFLAFDGQSNDAGGIWIGSGSNVNHQITLDLGSGNAVNPTGIEIHKFSWASVNSFRAEGSNDGSNWTLLLEETNANGAFTNAGGSLRVATYTIGSSSRIASNSIKEQTVTEPEIGIYPNPGTGNFVINFNSNYEGKIGLIVRNALGKEIQFREITGISEYNLNLSAFPNGLYIVEFQLNHTRLTRQIVISR